MKEVIISNFPKTVTLSELELKLSSPDNNDKVFLAEVIFHRLNHRYIEPLKKNLDSTSSFLLLAATCLLIEAVQCFRDGKNDTSAKNAGKIAFKNFFKDNAGNFPGFAAISAEFYKDIRCGILHQAETTNGWRLRKDGPILDKNERVINGELFFLAVQKSIEEYVQRLKFEDLSSPTWGNAMTKLKFICQNCRKT